MRAVIYKTTANCVNCCGRLTWWTTAGVRASSQARQLEILTARRQLTHRCDNDPLRRALIFGACRLFWKVDYYDQALTNHSPVSSGRDGHQARAEEY